MLLLVVFLPIFQLQERVHTGVMEKTRLYETLEKQMIYIFCLLSTSFFNCFHSLVTCPLKLVE